MQTYLTDLNEYIDLVILKPDGVFFNQLWTNLDLLLTVFAKKVENLDFI